MVILITVFIKKFEEKLWSGINLNRFDNFNDEMSE